MKNSSIWPINRTLLSTAILGQTERGSNGNEGVLNISQISKAGGSTSNYLLSYSLYSLERGLTTLQRCRRCILQSSWLGYRDSVSLFRFLLLGCVLIISCEIVIIWCLKYLYSGFSSHLHFVEFVIFLFVLTLTLLL